MNPLLYGLKVDFVRNNGHYMVISADGGLKMEQLSTFQVNMLLSNKIPHLLNLQVEERDLLVNLYYNISDKRMLTHWLRMGSISLKQFFSLLYAIVDIVSESNIYMLQEGRYVLKEDYIYCGKDITDVHLTYIPKELLPEKNALSVDLQQLASRLIHKVSELSGSGYQELMSYLMEESFNIPVCKQLLQKHRNKLDAATQEERGTILQSTAKSNYSQATGGTQFSKSANHTTINSTPAFSKVAPFTNTSESITTAADSKLVAPPFMQPAFSPSWFEEDDQRELTERNKKLRLPVLLVGFLILGLVWKLYLDHPSEGWLFICSGLSLLVIDFMFITLQIWKPKTKDSESLTWATVHNNLSQERQLDKKATPLLPFFTPSTVVPRLSNGTDNDANKAETFHDSRLESRLDSMRQEATASKPPESYYQGLEQRTTLLAPMDATVFLSASLLQQGVKAARPYLEWSSDGMKNIVHIDKSPFVIGRKGQGVDYIHKETGISRIHAEITTENEQSTIKDLGSRNGSFINGEILVPYRVYILQEGDIVKLISTEFVFKMGL